MKNPQASTRWIRCAGPACRNLVWLGLMILACGNAGAKPKVMNAHSRVQPVSVVAHEMLAVHNAIRTDVKLPPLQWSNALAAYSQKWADTLLAKDRPAHNPNSPYGENIFIAGPGSTASTVVKEWASEARDYAYRTNACSGDCGHYTQIVWRDTMKVGCAVARDTRREIWVCSYDPPGNYQGEWPY
jgi:pathogenesis-related protein 1